ncbi:MAG: hypothetical protein ACI311_06850 [Bacilli bacterium]
MITYKEEFLNNFVQEEIFNSSSFGILLKGLKKVNFICKDNKIKESQFLNEAKTTLNIIQAIMHKPHFSIKREDIILRSEVATNLSDDNIIDTINDSSLWKRKGDSFLPEFVHTTEHDETIVFYENIIVSRCIDLISNELEILLKTNERKIHSLESYLGNSAVSFAPYSFMDKLSSQDYLENVLVEDVNTLNTDYESYISLLKRCDKLKNSNFYRLTSKAKMARNDLNMTNIFANDNRYNCVFRFYKKYLFNSINTDELNKQYKCYCILRLVKVLNQVPSMKCISSDAALSKKGTITLFNDPVSFENKKFKITLIIKETNGFDLVVYSKDFNQEKKYYISCEVDINNKNSFIINDLLQEKLSLGYEDVFILTLNNTSRNYRRVIEINFVSDKDTELSNFINSFMLVFMTKLDLYDNVCPICGKKKVKYEENVYECVTCHGKYSIKKENDSNFIWVYRLGDVK